MRSLPILVLAASVVVGCGSNVVSSSNSGSTSGTGTSGGGSSGGGTTGPVTQGQVGSQGGVVSDVDGGNNVDIPAGALAADTVITVSVTGNTPPPGSGQAVGPTIAFGPEGTTFATPVTVTLTYDATRLPTGKTAADLVILTAPHGTQDFVALAQTANDATHVSAQTSHFSDFVVAVPPPRPSYPAGPYAVTLSKVIQNYTFTGYVSQTAGTVDNTASWAPFSLQDLRNLTQASGAPFRYLLLDFAAGWCVPCNDEADEYGAQGTNSTKVGAWLAEGGLYATVLVQNYDEGNPSSPVQADVNTWLSAHEVQSTLAGDVDGVLFGSISQSAFPANLVINLDTMQIEDAWYGLDDGKISSEWEAKLAAP